MEKINLAIASMDEEETSYHLRFRPRAICGRRLKPNGGHRRPRPIGGVYATRYSHANPTSEPIGRSPAFLEQLVLPDPVITGNAIWDTSNLEIKGMFEGVVQQRKRIHARSSTTPKLKGNSSIVASMWKVCDDTLTLSRKVSLSLLQAGFLPYPEPLWFSSRETGMPTSHDITSWNVCVQGLLAAKDNGRAKHGGSTFPGSQLTTEEDGVLSSRAKESGMLPKEGKKTSMFPGEGGLAETKGFSKLPAEEEEATLAEKAKGNIKFSAGEGALADNECINLHEEELALAEKAMWPNWPSSFINWDYEKKFEKEQAEAEAREQAQAKADAECDEWEEKAMRCIGA